MVMNVMSTNTKADEADGPEDVMTSFEASSLCGWPAGPGNSEWQRTGSRRRCTCRESSIVE